MEYVSSDRKLLPYGMSREELYAEAYKDLIAISTPMNMFIDKVCKKATMMSPF